MAVSLGDTPPILPIAVVQQSIPSDTAGMEGSILLLSCAVQPVFITEEVQSVMSEDKPLSAQSRDFCEKPKQRNKDEKVLVDFHVEFH